MFSLCESILCFDINLVIFEIKISCMFWSLFLVPMFPLVSCPHEGRPKKAGASKNGKRGVSKVR